VLNFCETEISYCGLSLISRTLEIQLDRFSICLYVSALNSLKKVKISFCGITFASKTLVSWKQTIDHKKIFFFLKYIVIITTWITDALRNTFIVSQCHTFNYMLIFYLAVTRNSPKSTQNIVALKIYIPIM